MTSRVSSRWNDLVSTVTASNPFYRGKLDRAGIGGGAIPSLADLGDVPFTTKEELVADQVRHPPFGSNLTFPIDAYTRIHQTSGSTGRPLRWLDTAESWAWWLACWETVFRAAGVTAADRVFVAFSFGPFIGFWAAFDAVARLGAMAIPGGGMTTPQRLAAMQETDATVLVSTPTYALRLAEAAREQGRDLAGGPVRLTIHAGEPGANVPAVRAAIEEAWGAAVFDHAGATEVGAWGFACGHADHLHVNQDEFIVDVVDPHGDGPAPTGTTGAQMGELVLTNLGRRGSPVIRYRTGDLVELSRCACPCGRDTVYARGGVLGRADDMFVVRGVNVYPSAIENVIREEPRVVEFDVHVRTDRAMTALDIRIEVGHDEPTVVEQAVTRLVHDRIHLRPRVSTVPPGTLPRPELKSQRFTMTRDA